MSLCMLCESYLWGSELILCLQSLNHIFLCSHFHWKEARGRRVVRDCAVTHSEPPQNLKCKLTHIHACVTIVGMLKWAISHSNILNSEVAFQVFKSFKSPERLFWKVLFAYVYMFFYLKNRVINLIYNQILQFAQKTQHMNINQKKTAI